MSPQHGVQTGTDHGWNSAWRYQRPRAQLSVCYPALAGSALADDCSRYTADARSMFAQIIFRPSSSIENRAMVSVRAVVLLFVFASTFLSVAEVRTAAVTAVQATLTSSSCRCARGNLVTGSASTGLLAGHSHTGDVAATCCSPRFTDRSVYPSASALPAVSQLVTPLRHAAADCLCHRAGCSMPVAASADSPCASSSPSVALCISLQAPALGCSGLRQVPYFSSNSTGVHAELGASCAQAKKKQGTALTQKLFSSTEHYLIHNPKVRKAWKAKMAAKKKAATKKASSSRASKTKVNRAADVMPTCACGSPGPRALLHILSAVPFALSVDCGCEL